MPTYRFPTPDASYALCRHPIRYASPGTRQAPLYLNVGIMIGIQLEHTHGCIVKMVIRK